MNTHDDILPDETYISVAEAAELLDITENAVRKRIHRNSLPAIKEGRDWRIRLADLAAEEIIDIESDPAGPLAGRPPAGRGAQRDDPQGDSLRDVPQGDSSPHDVPLGDMPSPETGLRLAEQQLAIFVDQFVRPKDERIAELERQIGRLEAESESLVKERDNASQLERENGRLSERVRRLEVDLAERAAKDQQRDEPAWWQFWRQRPEE